jgi:drug/metabolite transporter (DMT)-like permease
MARHYTHRGPAGKSSASQGTDKHPEKFAIVASMTPPAGPRTSAAAPPIAIAALLAGAAAVGASAIFVRLSELGALPSAFFRPFLAIPVVWLWLAIAPGEGEKRQPRTAREYGGLLLAGAFFAGDLAFWHLSLHHTTVANATLLANAAPVFVVLAGWILFGRRVGRTFLGGMALALAGGACLVGGTLSLDPENLVGDGYGIVTAMFLASYLMAVERLRTQFSTATIMLWTSIGTAAVLLPVALASGETMVAVTPYGWAILLGLGLVSHAGGQGMIAYALAHLPASLTAVGLLFEPMAAAVMAMIVLAEPLTAWQTVGGGIILWGIFIARRGTG